MTHVTEETDKARATPLQSAAAKVAPIRALAPTAMESAASVSTHE